MAPPRHLESEPAPELGPRPEEKQQGGVMGGMAERIPGAEEKHDSRVRNSSGEREGLAASWQRSGNKPGMPMVSPWEEKLWEPARNFTGAEPGTGQAIVPMKRSCLFFFLFKRERLARHASALKTQRGQDWTKQKCLRIGSSTARDQYSWSFLLKQRSTGLV